MRRVLFVLLLLGGLGIARGQELERCQVIISPNGITFGDNATYIIIESGKPQKEILSDIIKNLKTKHLSKNLRIDTIDNTIIVNDYIPGFTKTDKSAGSAYLLDLSYKIAVDVKDDKYRISTPSIKISANQKYESDAVIANKGVQFAVDMGIKGKRDIWNKKAKTMFIYDEKDKLVEKGTKDKLEKELSSVINIIATKGDELKW